MSFLLTLSIVGCSYTEKENTLTVVKEQNPSSIIGNLKNLNVKQNQALGDKDLQLFLQGYKHIEVGTIDKAEDIFTDLQSSQDNEAIEYGEYGLLLLAEPPRLYRRLDCLSQAALSDSIKLS